MQYQDVQQNVERQAAAPVLQKASASAFSEVYAYQRENNSRCYCNNGQPGSAAPEQPQANSPEANNNNTNSNAVQQLFQQLGLGDALSAMQNAAQDSQLGQADLNNADTPNAQFAGYNALQDGTAAAQKLNQWEQANQNNLAQNPYASSELGNVSSYLNNGNLEAQDAVNMINSGDTSDGQKELAEAQQQFIDAARAGAQAQQGLGQGATPLTGGDGTVISGVNTAVPMGNVGDGSMPPLPVGGDPAMFPPGQGGWSPVEPASYNGGQPIGSPANPMTGTGTGGGHDLPWHVGAIGALPFSAPTEVAGAGMSAAGNAVQGAAGAFGSDLFGSTGGAIAEAATAPIWAPMEAAGWVGQQAAGAISAVGGAVGDAAGAAVGAVGDAASAVGNFIGSIF